MVFGLGEEDDRGAGAGDRRTGDGPFFDRAQRPIDARDQLASVGYVHLVDQAVPQELDVSDGKRMKQTEESTGSPLDHPVWHVRREQSHSLGRADVVVRSRDDEVPRIREREAEHEVLHLLLRRLNGTHRHETTIERRAAVRGRSAEMHQQIEQCVRAGLLRRVAASDPEARCECG